MWALRSERHGLVGLVISMSGLSIVTCHRITVYTPIKIKNEQNELQVQRCQLQFLWSLFLKNGQLGTPISQWLSLQAFSFSKYKFRHVLFWHQIPTICKMEDHGYIACANSFVIGEIITSFLHETNELIYELKSDGNNTIGA